MGTLRRSTAGGYVWRKHLTGIWLWLILITAILAIYVIFAFWILIPGKASALEMIFSTLIMAGAMYFTYRRVSEIDSRWGKGARAEQLVGRELDKLHRDGFHVFHDYFASVGRGNVDHFVVGPSGVFAIETKSSRGEITSDGTELFLDGKPLRARNPLKQVKGEAREIHDLLLNTCGINRWVRPIVCYSDANVRTHEPVCDVEVLQPGALGRVISSYGKSGALLSEYEIRAISKLLQKEIGIAPSASPSSPPTVPGWLRKNLSPDRIFLVGCIVFSLSVSIIFAENTAAMFEGFAGIYRALGFLISHL